MTARRVRTGMAAALIALGAAASAAGGAACSGSRGQLMFVFQTDMSLPKDIDAIRLLVTVEGAVVFDETYVKLGDEDSIKLPATLGFLTPDDPAQALHLRVIASRGGDEGVEVIREVVTTVPEGRTAMLQVPVQFLCYGLAEVERDAQGNVKRDASGAVVVKSSCDEGKTCVAGSCKDAAVPSDDLPDYAPAEVFGGGSGDGDGLCFDTLDCFAEGSPAEVAFVVLGDGQRACAAGVPGSAELNVALLTQGGGICGERGCYVPLDAGSEAGWTTIDSSRIRLPDAVCERAEEGTLLGLVVAPAKTGTCKQKGSDLPTCGPWSSSGARYTEPNEATPLPIALGLAHPTALSVTASGVYWIELGTLDASGASLGDGAVKVVPLAGGEPQAAALDLTAPRDLAVDEAGVVFITSAGPAFDRGAVLAATPETGEVFPLLEERRLPEGIARRAGSLLWTELWGDQVLEVATTGAGRDLAAQGEPAPRTAGGPLGTSPHRLAAAADVVCWTYQGTFALGDGAVACQRDGEAPQVVASQQRTPIAIVIDVDAAGLAAAVYWATLDGGTIARAAIGSGGFGPPEELFQGQPLPSGLALDGEYIYWTNRDAGTVMRAPRAGGAPEAVAEGQLRPGAIAVDAQALYWLNGGSPDPEPGVPARDGAVMRLLK